MPHVPRAVPRPPPEVGFVYVIEVLGLYKIGLTRSWRSRRRGLAGLPARPRLVCLLRTFVMRRLERELHRRYATKRRNGEWFALDRRDIDELLCHPQRVEEG